MLLREFTVDNHTISLIEDSQIYIAQVISSEGEKEFYHEYKDYDRIKSSFNEIVEKIGVGTCSIETVLDILRNSTV